MSLKSPNVCQSYSMLCSFFQCPKMMAHSKLFDLNLSHMGARKASQPKKIQSTIIITISMHLHQVNAIAVCEIPSFLLRSGSLCAHIGLMPVHWVYWLYPVQVHIDVCVASGFKVPTETRIYYTIEQWMLVSFYSVNAPYLWQLHAR